MLRTLAVTILLTVGVLYLSAPFQVALFVLGVFVTPHRLVLFVPALLADALSRPTTGAIFPLPIMTLLVAALLIAKYLLVARTRVSKLTYGMEKK